MTDSGDGGEGGGDELPCHVQQEVKVGKTVCDEASVVPWEVHSNNRDRWSPCGARRQPFDALAPPTCLEPAA